MLVTLSALLKLNKIRNRVELTVLIPSMINEYQINIMYDVYVGLAPI